MEEISAFRRQLETHRPADWETLPDFPLYMDQVLLHGTADHPSGRERRSDSLYGQ